MIYTFSTYQKLQDGDAPLSVARTVNALAALSLEVCAARDLTRTIGLRSNP